MKTSFNSPEEYIPLQCEYPEGRILFDYREVNIDNSSDQSDNSGRTDFGSKYHRMFMQNVRTKDIKELTFPSSTLTSQSTYDKMGVSVNGYSVFDDLFVVFSKIILERTSDLFNELDIEKFKLISKDLQEFCHQDDLSDAFLNTQNKDRISTLFRIINIYEKISNQEFKQEFLSSFKIFWGEISPEKRKELYKSPICGFSEQVIFTSTINPDFLEFFIEDIESLGENELKNHLMTDVNGFTAFNILRESIELKLLIAAAKKAGCLEAVLKQESKTGYTPFIVPRSEGELKLLIEAAKEARCLNEVLTYESKTGHTPFNVPRSKGELKLLIEAAKEAGCLNEVLTHESKTGYTPFNVPRSEGELKLLIEAAKEAGCLRNVLTHESETGHTPFNVPRGEVELKLLIEAAKEVGCLRNVLTHESKTGYIPFTVPRSEGELKLLIDAAKEAGCLRNVLTHKSETGYTPFTVPRGEVELKLLIEAAKEAECLKEVLTHKSETGYTPFTVPRGEVELKLLIEAARRAGCLKEVLTHESKTGHTPFTVPRSEGELKLLIEAAKEAECLRNVLTHESKTGHTPFNVPRGEVELKLLIEAAKEAGCLRNVLTHKSKTGYIPFNVPRSEGELKLLIDAANEARCLNEVLTYESKTGHTPFNVPRSEVELKLLIDAANEARCLEAVLKQESETGYTPFNVPRSEVELKLLIDAAREAGCLKEVLTHKSKTGHTPLNKDRNPDQIRILLDAMSNDEIKNSVKSLGFNILNSQNSDTLRCTLNLFKDRGIIINSAILRRAIEFINRGKKLSNKEKSLRIEVIEEHIKILEEVSSKNSRPRNNNYLEYEQLGTKRQHYDETVHRAGGSGYGYYPDVTRREELSRDPKYKDRHKREKPEYEQLGTKRQRHDETGYRAGGSGYGYYSDVTRREDLSRDPNYRDRYEREKPEYEQLDTKRQRHDETGHRAGGLGYGYYTDVTRREELSRDPNYRDRHEREKPEYEQLGTKRQRYDETGHRAGGSGYGYYTNVTRREELSRDPKYKDRHGKESSDISNRPSNSPSRPNAKCRDQQHG